MLGLAKYATKIPQLAGYVKNGLTYGMKVGSEVLALATVISEPIRKLFESGKNERSGIMSNVLGRGFSSMVDALQIYSQKSELAGDLSIVAEQIFQSSDDKTIFDKVSVAYLILEKIPYLDSFVEGMIEKIPGFMTAVELLDKIFGTTFKKEIESGNKEAVSQVVQMLLQFGDLVMTQANYGKLKNMSSAK